ncbi:hypothetical protein EMM73_05775 [Rheinheimera sediminis]|uniref:hypothetical protein n=1 Tax=Rheinheimera sp. YQF-1 TaxID=2499626 RepID=UPI000FDCA699|nr:hypothetical protein [Rheinheimera sp. YQF-1]RVT47406.1 hypothetical protein EMM73_05775 [Rheinheimera sp. YQF-1]
MFLYSLPSMALTQKGQLKLFKKWQDSHFSQRQLPKANVRDDVSEKHSRCFCIRCHPWRSPKKGHRRCAPMLKNIPDVFVFAAIHGAHPKGPAKAVQKMAGQPFFTAPAAKGERQG